MKLKEYIDIKVKNSLLEQEQPFNFDKLYKNKKIQYKYMTGSSFESDIDGTIVKITKAFNSNRLFHANIKLDKDGVFEGKHVINKFKGKLKSLN